MIINRHYLITVIGDDKVGIVAKISGYLDGNNINIEEINQGIVGNTFLMVMIINMTNSKVDFVKLDKDLINLGKRSALKIKVYNKEVFDSVYKI